MISVIIPIYNVELYLRQCLDSLDVLGREDVEVILVNDGSTDGSRDICVEYKEKWNNIILIDKENGGLSDARNWGMASSRGEYIYFLDSDDWLAPGTIDLLYRFAVENDCDVVQGGFYYAYSDHLELDNRFLSEERPPFVLNRDKAMKWLVDNGIIKNFAWGKLYKSQVVKKHLFPVGKYYEDSYWQHLVLHEIGKYGIIPSPLYYYRQRENSISGTRDHRIFDLYKGIEEQFVFMQENYPKLTGKLAMRLWWSSYVSRGWDKDFKSYFEYVCTRYSPFLSDGFRNSLFYKLNVRDSKWLPLYNFYKRIKLRFEDKPLKRIELPK